MNGTHPQSGFSLAEVIVAFAILSIALVAVFKSYGLVSRGIVASETERDALAVARSLLATTGVTDELRLGEDRGTTDLGMTWSRKVVAYGQAGVDNALRPYLVTVEVFSSEELFGNNAITPLHTRIGPSKMIDMGSHREDGFTVLEMLVALSLMAVIGMYLSSAFGTGRRAWELRDRIEDGSSTAAVREFLRRQIEQAWPAYDRTVTGEQRIVFSGETDRIEFVSPISNGTNWGGLYRFAVSKAKSETTIRIAGDLHRSPNEKSAAAFDRAILESVQSLEISYYGPTSPDATPDWHDNWHSNAGLPQLVRMKVRMVPESTAGWPDLIVRLVLRSP